MEEAPNHKNIAYDPAKESKQPQVFKKRKQKKYNTILKKESRFLNNGVPKERKISIKWDNITIESQQGGKSKKKNSDELKRISSTRYKNYISQSEDEEDEYLKNLIKVNQLKVTDDLIKNILIKFNEPKEFKKVRTFSTHINRACFPGLKVMERSEDIKVFDGVKDDESKLTLKNTFINKFHKEFIGNGSEFYSDQDLKLI